LAGEDIYSKQSMAKIKIKTPADRRMDYFFYIQVSRLKGDRYLLIFQILQSWRVDKDIIRKLADYAN